MPDRSADNETETLRLMLGIYCAGKHGTKDGLCADCQELLDYAAQRVAKCPQQPGKPTCRACTIHCFDQGHRDRVRAAMRYAGPRMPLRHPLRTLAHLLGRRKP